MFRNKSKKEKINKKSPKEKAIPAQMDVFHGPTYQVAVTKSIRHESGLILDNGDSIIRDFKISSPNGDGWLVITIDRLYVLIKNKGVQLFLEWTMVNDYKVKGNNLTIIWHEENIHKYDYTIKILDGKISEAGKTMLVHQYTNDAKYTDIPAEEHEMIRRERVTKQVGIIRDLEDEMDGLRKKLEVLINEFDVTLEESDNVSEITLEESKAKSNLGMEKEINADREHVACHHYSNSSGDASSSWSQARKSAYITEGRVIVKRIEEIENVMEYERDNLHFIAFDTIQRSALIPPEIDNRDVWYNVYYDVKQNVYVQVGNTFPVTPELIKLRKDMNMPYGCGFSPERAEEIKTVMGQPATHHRYMSLDSMSTVWACMPDISIENYHYMRFINESPKSLHGKCSYLMTPNNYHNGLYNKEYIRLLMRTGNAPAWERDYDSKMHSEILEEELYLSKEGNVNYMSLALEDTVYANDEDIGRIPKLNDTSNEIGFVAFTFNR